MYTIHKRSSGQNKEHSPHMRLLLQQMVKMKSLHFLLKIVLRLFLGAGRGLFCCLCVKKITHFMSENGNFYRFWWHLLLLIGKSTSYLMMNCRYNWHLQIEKSANKFRPIFEMRLLDPLVLLLFSFQPLIFSCRIIFSHRRQKKWNRPMIAIYSGFFSSFLRDRKENGFPVKLWSFDFTSFANAEN